MKPLVIQINSLAEFITEVPPPGPVRLNLTERTEAGKYGIHTLVCNIDLQGLTVNDHVVWLHLDIHIQKFYEDFATPQGKEIYGKIPQMADIIRAWLSNHSYEIRSGQYGIPANIKPIRGQFECLKWVKEGEVYHLSQTN